MQSPEAITSLISRRDNLEEDLQSIEGSRITKEKQKELFGDAFRDLLAVVGDFIDYDNKKIQKLFPGLTRESKDGYDISQARVSLFVLPHEIEVGEGEKLPFDEFLRLVHYKRYGNDATYKHIAGLVTGKGEKYLISKSEEEGFLVEDRSNHALIILDDSAPLRYFDTHGDFRQLELILRHELAHLFLIGDNASSLYLCEGLVEYVALKSAAPKILFRVAYEPAFIFVRNIVRYLKTKGKSPDLLLNAYVSHNATAAEEAGRMLNEMLLEAGADSTSLYDHLSKATMDDSVRSYALLSEANEKIEGMLNKYPVER